MWTYWKTVSSLLTLFFSRSLSQTCFQDIGKLGTHFYSPSLVPRGYGLPESMIMLKKIVAAPFVCPIECLKHFEDGCVSVSYQISGGQSTGFECYLGHESLSSVSDAVLLPDFVYFELNSSEVAAKSLSCVSPSKSTGISDLKSATGYTDDVRTSTQTDTSSTPGSDTESVAIYSTATVKETSMTAATEVSASTQISTPPSTTEILSSNAPVTTFELSALTSSTSVTSEVSKTGNVTTPQDPTTADVYRTTTTPVPTTTNVPTSTATPAPTTEAVPTTTTALDTTTDVPTTPTTVTGIPTTTTPFPTPTMTSDPTTAAIPTTQRMTDATTDVPTTTKIPDPTTTDIHTATTTAGSSTDVPSTTTTVDPTTDVETTMTPDPKTDVPTTTTQYPITTAVPTTTMVPDLTTDVPSTTTTADPTTDVLTTTMRPDPTTAATTRTMTDATTDVLTATTTLVPLTTNVPSTTPDPTETDVSTTTTTPDLTTDIPTTSTTPDRTTEVLTTTAAVTTTTIPSTSELQSTTTTETPTSTVLSTIISPLAAAYVSIYEVSTTTFEKKIIILGGEYVFIYNNFNTWKSTTVPIVDRFDRLFAGTGQNYLDIKAASDMENGMKLLIVFSGDVREIFESRITGRFHKLPDVAPEIAGCSFLTVNAIVHYDPDNSECIFVDNTKTIRHSTSSSNMLIVHMKDICHDAISSKLSHLSITAATQMLIPGTTNLRVVLYSDLQCILLAGDSSIPTTPWSYINPALNVYERTIYQHFP